MAYMRLWSSRLAGPETLMAAKMLLPGLSIDEIPVRAHPRRRAGGGPDSRGHPGAGLSGDFRLFGPLPPAAPCAAAPSSGKMDSMRRGGGSAKEASGRDSLLSGPVALLVLATFSTMVGFQLLLSVVPLYAERTGGGASDAGLATAAFMLSTVLTQVKMPALLGRFGYRKVLVAGVLFLGLPAFLYPLAGGVVGVLAVTLARGVGFGVVTVVFIALIVDTAPPGRRGEALGLFGIAMTLPTIFCNPFGLWLVDASGYATAFLLGGLSPLLGLFTVGRLDLDGVVLPAGDGAGFFEGLRRGPLLRLVLIFVPVSSAGGVVVTFLPLAIPPGGLFSPAAALLVFGLASTASRLWAGRFGDRRDPHLLLVPGLIVAACGVAALPQGGPVTLGGALLFGGGAGLLQNATLMLTMNRVSEDERGLGSTLWNVSFDAGTGVGAFSFGLLVGTTGLPSAFYLSAAVLLAAIVLVVVDRRREKPGPPTGP
jgi:predicted MFS family arabinose efflux permease